MDNYSSDLVLSVVEFLNIVDSSRLATASRRYYYLVNQFRSRLLSPELVTSSSWIKTVKGKEEHLKTEDVARGYIPSLRGPPNLFLAFQNGGYSLSERLVDNVPKNAVIMGVELDSGDYSSGIQVNNENGRVESTSREAMMCGYFPNAVITPFSIDYRGEKYKHVDKDIEKFRTSILEQQHAEGFWKAIIVHSCGEGEWIIKKFISVMQRTFPNVPIIGGSICDAGYVSIAKYNEGEDLSDIDFEGGTNVRIKDLKKRMDLNGMTGVVKKRLENGRVAVVVQKEKDETVSLSPSNLQPIIDSPPLKHVLDSVFGVFLGGDIPVKTIISRGVTSVIQGKARPSSPLIVKEATVVRHYGNMVHKVTKIHDKRTGRTMMVAEHMMEDGILNAKFIGLKRSTCNDTHDEEQDDDGFELTLNKCCLVTGSYMIKTDGSSEEMESIEGAELDIYNVDCKEGLDDIERTISELKHTCNETILGAFMVSDVSRQGPMNEEEREELEHYQGSTRIMQMSNGEPMPDATRFAKCLPNVPCLGFYSTGQIGPLSTAGNNVNSRSVFRKRKSANQCFTVVFALFVVPKRNRKNFQSVVDDCRENVMSFVESRLSK